MIMIFLSEGKPERKKKSHNKDKQTNIKIVIKKIFEENLNFRKNNFYRDNFGRSFELLQTKHFEEWSEESDECLVDWCLTSPIAILW